MSTTEDIDTIAALARGSTHPILAPPRVLTRDENLAIIHRAVALRGLTGCLTRWIDADGNELPEPRAVSEMRTRFESDDLTAAETRMLEQLRGGEVRVTAPPLSPVEPVRDRVSLAEELEVRRVTLEGFARERTFQPRGRSVLARAEARDVELRTDPPTEARPGLHDLAPREGADPRAARAE